MSRRILVTHLTDVQNTGAEYADADMTVLKNFGRLPYLMRSGMAEVELELFTNDKCHNCSQIENTNTSVPSAHSRVDNRDLRLMDNEDLGFVNNPFRVWALGTDGRRECEIPFAIDPTTGRLRFTASTRQPFGACMYYEIARR